MKKIYHIFLFSLFVCIFSSTTVYAANYSAMTSQCTSIQISPAKEVYVPGETITVTATVQGDSVSNIIVRYAPAKRNIIQNPS